MPRSVRSNRCKSSTKSSLKSKSSTRSTASSRKKVGKRTKSTSTNCGSSRRENLPPKGKLLVKRLSKVTRNPFLNFARHLRMERDFQTMRELYKAAGAEWKNMSEDDKIEYIEEAAMLDAPMNPAPFYILGEHKLGRTLRRNMAKFKSLVDNAVEGNLDMLCKKEIGNSDGS